MYILAVCRWQTRRIPIGSSSFDTCPTFRCNCIVFMAFGTLEDESILNTNLDTSGVRNDSLRWALTIQKWLTTHYGGDDTKGRKKRVNSLLLSKTNDKHKRGITVGGGTMLQKEWEQSAWWQRWVKRLLLFVCSDQWTITHSFRTAMHQEMDTPSLSFIQRRGAM